jgi:glycosyltransferase involved in cell wall biosynthesis
MNRQQDIDVSVVIPVRNEEGNIGAVCTEVRQVCDDWGLRSEIIVVDDGSIDNTRAELELLGHRVRVVRLSQAYGHATALAVGIHMACGKYILTMDGDGQNNPLDIPKLIAKIKGGYDMVIGYRATRADRTQIRFISRMGYYLRRVILGDGLHDTGCSLRLYTRLAASKIASFGSTHYLVPTLLAQAGFKVGEISVHDRPRRHGMSKYTVWKVFRGVRDVAYVWWYYTPHLIRFFDRRLQSVRMMREQANRVFVERVVLEAQNPNL